MDAEQLWETTMDPEKRILLRVTMDESATSEIDLTFTTLWVTKLNQDVNLSKKTHALLRKSGYLGE